MQLMTFQELNIFNHFTLSAFYFMTCQHIFIITHQYSQTGYSASAGPAFVHELVESGFTINLNFDPISLLSPESTIWVCRPEW